MMYPAMIMVVVVGVISIMMILVVPKLLDIFENKADLPTSTKVLIATSNIFTNYWYVMALVIVLTVL